MRVNPLQDKKIVIDGRYLAAHRSGLARYTKELVKNIIALKLGIDLKLIVRDGEPFDPDLKKTLDHTSEKVEVIATRAAHYSAKEQTELYKLLTSLKPDLVHFTSFSHPIRYTKPFVVTIHDLTLHQYPNRASRLKQWGYRYVMRHAVSRSRLIFAVSQYTKRDILKSYDIPSDKVVVAYNGIDLHQFRPISNSKRLQDVTKKYKISKPFILYVGQWMEHKNIFRLIDAYIKFNTNPKHRGRFQLVVAGQPRHYEEYQTKIARVKTERDIVLPGFVADDDLPALYNAAQLFAFPSLAEGFGIPPLEAMACGTPVVSSNATSLPEVLGRAALFFNPKDAGAIAHAIERGLTDGALRQRLMDAGRAQAAQYSWAHTAQKTVDSYGRAL